MAHIFALQSNIIQQNQWLRNGVVGECVCVCTDRKTEIEMKFIIIIVWLHGFIIITHSPNNNCCISVCRMCTKLKAIDLTKSFVPFPMR